MTRRDQRSYRGCLLGGAIGDALGAPVEFDDLARIRSRYGPAGVRDLEPAYGRVGAITDDTQMLMFVAEGLLQARAAPSGADLRAICKHGYLALLRWLQTQLERWQDEYVTRPGLQANRELYSRRAPGNTCLSALRVAKARSVAEPINHSKGCGGIMRIAPVGLLGFEDPFLLGAELAALTHGHPSGYLSAGFMAQLIHQLVAGDELLPAIDTCRQRLSREPEHEETAQAVERALRLVRTGSGTAEEVEQLGAGWVGEEALGISLLCAALARDYEHGVLLAVNHSGDTDSTGAITGSILGLLLGAEGIRSDWRRRVELAEVLTQLADELLQSAERQAAGG